MDKINKIIKRDGRCTDFHIDKIANAIYKAAEVLGGKDHEMAIELAQKVEQYILEKHLTDSPTVEQIQDAVEKILIENGHARTAKEFILYRAERTRIREMNTRLMKVYEDLTFKEAQDNDIKRENANIDGDTAMGTMLKYGSEGAKQFYEMFVLHPEHSKAHREGDIHIHDLDFLTLTTTCCQIDLEKLFQGGFSTGHGFLREPNDIQSYAALACIAIQSNQNDQHGGQSVPNFDYGMAAGVKKTYKKLYWNNLGKSMDILCDTTDGDAKAKEAGAAIERDFGISPTLADDNDYSKKEAKLLKEFLSAEQVK
ncbi:MAG: anaerobic ribonucleoside triphosphate reductase, partial [Clostridia bacterium]|nr:anaerobic ribonucleoside triphosphate reductase [Clostridia bacterium]